MQTFDESMRFCKLMAFEVDRARELLLDGATAHPAKSKGRIAGGHRVVPSRRVADPHGNREDRLSRVGQTPCGQQGTFRTPVHDDLCVVPLASDCSPVQSQLVRIIVHG